MHKVLIADDEEEIRDLFVEALERHGYEALAARDGHEAVDMVRREQVGVAFVDMRMPGMSGLDALGEIVRISPGTQVVMITGHAEGVAVEDALRSGSFLCLMKPFKVRDVLALLDVLLMESAAKKAQSGRHGLAA